MVKIVNKTKMPVPLDQIPVGECFIHNGDLFMRVRYDSRYACLRFASGVVQTNIHSDVKVQPVDIQIEVGAIDLGGF